MNLNTKDLLSNLIQTGADASLNLFKISFSLLDEKLPGISVRTTTFVSPTRDSGSVQVPFQNTSIDIPSSGATINKQITFQTRLDANYEILKTLRKYQLIDNYGRYIINDSKKIPLITVEAYKPQDGDLLVPVYEWKFHNNYILKVTPLSYSSDATSAATVNITFVWGTYEETSDIFHLEDLLDLLQNTPFAGLLPLFENGTFSSNHNG